MTIQFGGLATGLDTKSIISQLMALEQQPVTRMQNDATWMKSRLTAFTQLDTNLKSFASSITSLSDASSLLKRSVTQSSSDYLSASVTSSALPGTSYQVEVVSLAQVQKSISTGFTDATNTTFGTGTLNLTVGGTSTTININSGDNSLKGISAAINSANLGVSASLISDGSASPNRLILTGANVGKTFSLDSSGLTGGTDILGSYNLNTVTSTTGVASSSSLTFGTGTLNFTVNGTNKSINIATGDNSLDGIINAINLAGTDVTASITNDGSTNHLVLTGKSAGTTFSLSSNLSGGTDVLDSNLVGTITNPPVQLAAQAKIKVDTVDITSDSNTLTTAIPGMTLNLLQAKLGTTTTLNVSQDNTSIQSTIKAFATGYNQVVNFITGQSVVDGKGGGVLNGDAGINAIKRHLQSMLTQPFANSGPFTTLSQLGFKTQKDGTVTVDDTILSKAVNENSSGVASLLAGEGGKKGLGSQFKDYLSSITNSTTGILKGRTDSTNANLKQINARITNMQTRIAQRQKTMEAQYSAMETLVSGMNSQSTYLTQQMTLINNMMTGSKS